MLAKSYVNLPARTVAEAHILTQLLASTHLQRQHGDYSRLCQKLQHLPFVQPSVLQFNDVVTIGASEDTEHSQVIAACADDLIPWRKGPFSLFGTDIDGEWRSDYKWHRLLPHLEVAGKRLLDVGANNGYYMFRCIAAGARSVIGIDAQLNAVAQFYLLQKYAQLDALHLLPVRLETLAELAIWEEQFDIVLALGTLYHARNPIAHLTQLRDRLTKNGELYLETLVIDGATNTLITPHDSYLRMRNVWFVTSEDLVCRWLERLRFNDIQVLSRQQTDSNEQRRTRWMPFSSLADALNVLNPKVTVEGLVRPTRAIFYARK